MRRERIDLNELAAWDNLLLACWKAARGKRTRPEIASFLDDLDRNLAHLAASIREERAPVGRFRRFAIRDPKPRLIHAACFEDRVLHHAVLNLAEPVFERSLLDSVFACRPGKGVHKAVAAVQQNLRAFPWYVQVDVDRYFPSIPHARLRERLARRFKGEGFLNLLGRIIDTYHAAPGFGLPIGSLTSQHFANLYLDGVDRFLVSHPAVRGQVRYMDDIIWWCDEQRSARETRDELSQLLGDCYGLRLKPEVRLNRSAQGARYCGFQVRPGTILLAARKRRRYRELRAELESAWEAGTISDRELQSAYDAVLAITLHCDSRGFRLQNLQRAPCRYDDTEGRQS